MMALGLIGGLVSGIGSLMQAQAAAQAAEFNAKVNEINAKTARWQAGADAKQRRREKMRAMGSMRAQYSANGVQLAGSALDVASDSFLEMTLDEKMVVYGGEVKATDFENQAKLNKMEARSHRVAGGIGFISGALSGVGNALRV